MGSGECQCQFLLICSDPTLFLSQMSAGAFCYLVFCGICFLVALYVYFIIPETKNKTFMEISQLFTSSRPTFFSNLPNSFKMIKLNGYGALENSSLEFSGSGSNLPWGSSVHLYPPAQGKPSGWTVFCHWPREDDMAPRFPTPVNAKRSCAKKWNNISFQPREVASYHLSF